MKGPVKTIEDDKFPLVVVGDADDGRIDDATDERKKLDFMVADDEGWAEA